jgi:hypothetical protein
MIADVTSPTTVPSEEHYGPWNPGIESILPREFMPLATVYSSENVSSSLRDLQEMSDFCGLSLEKLSTFTPKRLALHEVLIRVMADLTVPDGEKYEDLGINFRHMTRTIMNDYILAELPKIEYAYDQVKQAASEFIAKILLDSPVTSPGVRSQTSFCRGAAGWLPTLN